LSGVIARSLLVGLCCLGGLFIYGCSDDPLDTLVAGLDDQDKAWIAAALSHDGTIRKREETARVAVTGHYEPRHLEILTKVASDLAEVAGHAALELGESRLVTPTPPVDWPDDDSTGLLIVSPVPFSIQMMNYLSVLETHLGNHFDPSYKMQTTVNHLLRRPVPTCRGEIDIKSEGMPFIMVIDNSAMFEAVPEAEAILARCGVELYLGALGWDVSRASPYAEGLDKAAITRAFTEYVTGTEALPLSRRAAAALRLLYSDRLEAGDDAAKLDTLLKR